MCCGGNFINTKQIRLPERRAEKAVIGLTKDDNFGILLGKAGAGKTITMKAISEIYEQSGSRVIGMSLSAVASENLGKDAGIESATIASWAHRWRLYESAKEKFLSFDSVVTDGILKQLGWYSDLKRYESSQLKSGDVIIVDEAGMVGTQEWKAILNMARNPMPRLLLWVTIISLSRYLLEIVLVTLRNEKKIFAN